MLDPSKNRVWYVACQLQVYSANHSGQAVKTAVSAQVAVWDEGNYFMPATSVDDAYSLSDLFPDSNGPNYSMNFQVEGINPAEKVPVKAILLYNNGSSWQEVAASFVNVKVIEAKVILNVNNDKTYELDDDDHKLKDQHDGFQGWYASRLPDGTIPDTDESRSSSHGLENMFPVKIELDPSIADIFKYYIKIEPISHSGSGILCENIGSGNDRLKYLTDSSSGTSQLSKTTNLSSSMLIGTDASGTYTLPSEDYDFLFALNSTGEYKITLYVELQSDSNMQITVDTCKITGRDIAKYFWYGSCRGTKVPSFDYLTDKTRYATMDRYPDVLRQLDFGDRDPNRDKYLLYLHGYNVNYNEAVTWNKVVFRRLYWSGYRGNFIGITWHGDEYALVFDPNVHNAMETSPSVMRFIKNTVQDTWNISPSNINIAAHSLGNLVMWDALRLFKHKYSGKAAKTAISIEAAVWQETFWDEADFTYNWEEYIFNELLEIINSSSGTSTYSIDDLTKNSWSFWFAQKTVGGNSLIAKDAVDFTVNSYLPGDGALNYMVTNDNLLRPQSHFLRPLTTYRTPASLYVMPRMLQKNVTVTHRFLPPGYWKVDSEDLTVTAGTVSTSYFGNNKNASSYGWRNIEHSDLKNLELYNIFGWYRAILYNNIK